MDSKEAPELTNARAQSGMLAVRMTDSDTVAMADTNCKRQSCRLDTNGVGTGRAKSNSPAQT
ncbi:hypothetical protein PF005_g10061 [Phytophthora fragariae]|uniref:Uncharacterized protein n=2 Tax=Phytophthora TaxID=4783 RepID=A0A6A3ZJ66_9STRA|nr:hypothetical protein PF003_g522 [Phytophthora fragariae]KAE9039736.1 hypothetical protein PR001_g7392 [Phytophthora rubi]KAE8939569.1 hypothetical protein PF009_g10586 [Phytophthora fragariae]KAE9012054.1 hypothetical protein PF011_g9087 [Phytophthora fragariae]KAE9114403.1 hypothetical protein PF007_g10377 [Phytophthora fragariae]